MEASPQARRASAYYWAPVDRFVSEHPDRILGKLTAAHTHALDVEQRHAWEEEIRILKAALTDLPGTIYLEFDVPRLGSRIDAVLISGPAVFPIEFKVGERDYHLSAYNQAWDYALDLKNFHLASHHAAILPVLVATEAARSDSQWQRAHDDAVRPPRRCQAADLRRVVDEGLTVADGRLLDGQVWGTAPYQPTPTIIEAACALYSRHSVEAISRNDAGAKNLPPFTRTIGSGTC